MLYTLIDLTNDDVLETNLTHEEVGAAICDEYEGWDPDQDDAVHAFIAAWYEGNTYKAQCIGIALHMDVREMIEGGEEYTSCQCGAQIVRSVTPDHIHDHRGPDAGCLRCEGGYLKYLTACFCEEEEA